MSVDSKSDDTSPEGQHASVSNTISVTGSFNGYFTVEEMYTFMKQIGSDLNPFSLGPMTIGKSIDDTHEIKALCIGQCHACAPATLYTGLHHGREPMSMMTLVYTLRDIRNRFRAGNVEVTSLLESRQLWFIPIVNPAGYAKNIRLDNVREMIYRKNTRQTCISDPNKNGVDINRNYDYCFLGAPTSEICSDHSDNKKSGSDDKNCHIGNSDDGCSEKFRGDAPFSEPETIAVRNFVLSHNISNALNYHSYGGNLFWPFSCPHHSVKRRLKWIASLEKVYFIGRELSKLNKYKTGNVVDVLKYSAAGDASDWMYGEHDIVALTPETGPTDEEMIEGSLAIDLGNLYGFFPPKDKIEEFANVNSEANIKMAWFAGVLYNAKVTGFKSSTIISKQQQPIKQYDITINLKNIGLKSNKNRIMLALTALEGNEMGSHRILKLNEFSSASSPLFLHFNDTVSSTFQVNGDDLNEIKGVNTQLYIVVADSVTCTLFSLSNNGWNNKHIVGQPSHLRSCDLCESFYAYEGFSTRSNVSRSASWGGDKYENFSLPIKHANLINSAAYCTVKNEDMSSCSGKGIPNDNMWQLYLAVSLVGFILTFGLVFLFLKFRTYSCCKCNVGKVNFDSGKRKKKYKDMTEVYDSSIHDTQTKYKDWDIEEIEDVETDSIINIELSSKSTHME